MKIFSTSVLIVTIMLSLVAEADAKKVFSHYDVNKGLSQNTVLAIAQDKTGFMWFGTKNGLNRFDGHSFRIYRNGNDGHSLKGSYVNALCESSDNKLWVGTSLGLSIYSPVTDTFEPLNAKTRNGAEIHGNVNIITAVGDFMYVNAVDQGLFRYNIKTGELICKPRETFMAITHVSVDGNGVVWIGTYGMGVFTANSDLTGMQPVRDKNGNVIFSGTSISDIICAEQGQVFVSTNVSGMNVFNSYTKETTHLIPEKGTVGSNVHSLLRNGNEIWVATENGLYVYEMITHETKHYQYESTNPFSLSDNPLQTLFCDRDGGIWIGTYFGGANYTQAENPDINRCFPRVDVENSLHGRRVREIVEDRNGKIWIGTEDQGLNVYNPVNGDIDWVSDSRMFPNIHGLCADGNYIWVGTFSNGLKIVDANTHKVIKSFDADGTPGALHDNNIFSVTKTRTGRIYLGTLSGLCMYDNGGFVYISGVPSTIVYDVQEDKRGNLWVATYGSGVYMRPKGSKKWTSFTSANHKLSSDNAVSITETRNGDVWICTEGGGAYRYRNGQLAHIPITKDDRYITVYDIAEDGIGRLWFTTDKGMVCCDANVKDAYTMNTSNGLLDNDFNYKSLLRASDGRMYAGSLSGFVSFMPETIHNTNHPTTIVATELFVNNSEMNGTTSPYGQLKQNITETKRLVLDYNQRSFTLKMAVLAYGTEQHRQLEYKLDGFDKEWQPLTDDYAIRYTNLPPGKYKLIVRTASSADNGRGHQYELKIKIKPPFYLAWYAWIFYFLIAGVLAYLIWRYANQRVGMHRRLAMEKFQHEKEYELYQSKISFFTNVAHEIRTPLTLIKAPLENILKKGSVNSVISSELSIMDQNVNRLLDLTKQLLDFRKAERDGMKLNFESCDIGGIIQSVYVRFTSLMNEKGVEANFSKPETPLFADVDKEALTKVISNLINNAVKYCDKSINVELSVDGDKFCVITKNDGNVVSPAMRKEIFTPFVRGNNVVSNVNGTGIGLALARTLTELHGGTLEMLDDSNLNVFCLKIPIKQEKIIDIAESEPVAQEPIENIQNVEKDAPTVLIVEDNLQMQQYEKLNLQGEYNVLTADNGEEAMKILMEEDVSVIVSDVMMEPMDGFTLCRKVKNDVAISHIPLILLTALTLDSSKIEGMESGADAYIEKPFSMDYLLSTIKNLLRTRQNAKSAYAKSPFISSETVSISKADEAFIERLNAVMEKNLGDSDFGITEMAEQMFMSRTGLNRKIRGVFNLTSNNYIKIERLKKAANLMKTKDYKVNEVCYMVGFTSPSYFTQCFYKQFGLLPKEFINADNQQ